MNKKFLKISMLYNFIIFSFTLIATFMMFYGIGFTSNKGLLLDRSFHIFKFYTVDSNVLMGISALIFLIYEIKLYNGKRKSIPRFAYLLKYISTVGVMLTFTVVFTYLSPHTIAGFLSMIYGSNYFFHLIIPLFSLVTFIFFEKNNKLKFKDTFYGLSSMSIYCLYYIINVILHMENGRVSPEYDWYYFVQNGVWTMVIVVPIIFLVTYLISFLLWKFNKK